jgi:hypothetical protein
MKLHTETKQVPNIINLADSDKREQCQVPETKQVPNSINLADSDDRLPPIRHLRLCAAASTGFVPAEPRWNTMRYAFLPMTRLKLANPSVCLTQCSDHQLIMTLYFSTSRPI